MRRSIWLISSLCISLLTIGTGLRAEEQQTTSSWRYWIGAEMQYFSYEEFDDCGQFLDGETGFVPGFSGKATKDYPTFFVEGRFRWLSQILLYDGHTQSGVECVLGTPVKTDSNAIFLDYSAIVGSWFRDNTLAFYGGLGFESWDRDILSTTTVGGLFETYSWYYLEAGTRYRWQKTATREMGVDLRLRYPLNPELTVDIGGKPTLDLGEEIMWRLGVPISFIGTTGKRIVLEPYLEIFGIGRSNDVTVGAFTVHEPRSDTMKLGVSASISIN